MVDENNNLMGEKELRSVVHSTGLWHRTVHIYFFRRAGDVIEFLVHLRSKTKDLNPDKWDTRFGGHVKSGESVEGAVVSEIKEETGLDIAPRELIKGEWKKSNLYPNNEFTEIYYFEFNGSADDLTFNDGEVQEVKWMSSGDILKSMETDASIWSGRAKNFKEMLESLKKSLNYKK